MVRGTFLVMTVLCRYGGWVSRYPLVFILGAVAIAGAASSGFYFQWKETDNNKLWLPKDNEFVKNEGLMNEEFPSNRRVSSIIIEADNVLKPEIINDTFNLLQEIKKIKIATQGQGNYVELDSRNYVELDSRSNPSNKTLFKKMCKNMKPKSCLARSILLAFMTQTRNGPQLNSTAITGLSSLTEVLTTINEKKPGFNPKDHLGQIEYSSTNKSIIIRAQAMKLTIIGEMEGTGVDDSVMDFERSLAELVKERKNVPGMKAYAFTQTSMGDEVGEGIANDKTLLISGYALIFVYFIINLGRMNSVEQRFWLSVTGIIAIVMGIATAFGLAALIGVFNTDLNMLLFSLVLGIGIDDMFVIMQAFENLSPQDKKMILAKRLGLTMKHAGVAITITTITDLLAFAIGASTVIPALASFCIYASLGLLFVYLYVITFFLAFFSYDQRRIEGLRDGCICCWIKDEDWRPTNKCSQESLLQTVFEKVSEFLVLLPMKIGILLITLAILAGGIYGVVTLEISFDFKAFINEETSLRNYMESKEVNFPGDGAGGFVHFNISNYAADMDKIQNLLEEMEHLATEDKNNILPTSIRFWFKDFVIFVNKTDFEGYKEQTFLEDLQLFLCKNPQNPQLLLQLKKYAEEDLKFASSINCSNPNQTEAPQLILSSMAYQHPAFPLSADGIRAMNEIFDVTKKYNFSGNVFAISQSYGKNIIMEIIGVELVRNMLMALGVVFLCTLVLIADVASSFIVLLTVALTIVNVAGYANFWGLNIDTLFAVYMTISIGLCVDYSAHIAHGFMVEKGDRNTRMKMTLINVGPAVFNGGFSTFLSFIFLSMSESYIFMAYFKIFFLVVFFGLFHGLLFLPVLLSLAGPKCHESLRPRGRTATRVRTIQVHDPVADSNVIKAEASTKTKPGN